MKRILSFCAVLLVILSFANCTPPAEPEKVEVEIIPSINPTNDSNNESQADDDDSWSISDSNPSDGGSENVEF